MVFWSGNNKEIIETFWDIERSFPGSSSLPQEDNVVLAEPQKGLFIGMLARDISMMECILYLIDNSIHRIIYTHHFDIMNIITGDQKMSFYYRTTIDIDFSDSFFQSLISAVGWKEKTLEKVSFSSEKKSWIEKSLKLCKEVVGFFFMTKPSGL